MNTPSVRCQRFYLSLESLCSWINQLKTALSLSPETDLACNSEISVFL